jgi:hypothetical protein
MKPATALLAICLINIAAVDLAVAQPQPPPRREYPRQGQPAPPPQRAHYGQAQDRGRQPDNRAGGQRFYYKGQWVDHDEWDRHAPERERWARQYRSRQGHRGDDASQSLIAGIIGFALGAAIVGSQDEADRARAADQTFDQACRQRYRSYDARSRTYLGTDGLRHYCK